MSMGIRRRDELLEILSSRKDGCTSAELAEILNIGRGTAHEYLKAIKDQGLLQTSGLRATGKSRGLADVYYVKAHTPHEEPPVTFQSLLKLTVEILEAVPPSKRGPLAKKVAKIVKEAK